MYYNGVKFLDELFWLGANQGIGSLGEGICPARGVIQSEAGDSQCCNLNLDPVGIGHYKFSVHLKVEEIKVVEGLEQQ